MAPTEHRRATLVLAAASAIAGPALGATAFWHWVQHHRAATAGLALGYEGALACLVFVGRVVSELQNRWLNPAVNGLDGYLRRLLSRYERSYRQFLFELNHDMDLRGITTQGSYSLDVNQVFVDLSLSARSTHQVSGGVINGDLSTISPDPQLRSSVWKFFGETMRSRLSQAIRSHHISSYRDKHYRRTAVPLAILGGPGSGKTTLLKHMTLTLCKPNRARGEARIVRGKLPVLLLLRQHAPSIVGNPQVPLAQLARASVVDITRKEPPGWFEKQLSRGRCVIMLDGLDEVGSEEVRRAVVDWVDRQIAANSNNAFVITSRPYGYQSHPLSRAIVTQVRPFTEDQIITFAENWYRYTEFRRANRMDSGVRKLATEGATDLVRKLRVNPALYALAENPLLLTMIAHVHNYRGALPGTRAELYREIFQVFLGKRQEAKGLPSHLTTDQRELALRAMAFEMMTKRQRDISRADALAIVTPVLEGIRESLDPQEFLDSIETLSGLLLQRESDLYCFPHLTFQEYLAAAHIAERNLVSVLLSNVGDEWWRETALLYVAQWDANAIVQTCLDEHPDSVAALALAADCVEEARELSPSWRRQVERVIDEQAESQDPARRVIAASIALARKYRRAVRIDSNAWICTEPLASREYRMFRSTQPTPQVGSGLSLSPVLSPDEPVRGLQSGVATEFLAWANNTHGAARLPTKHELEKATALKLIDLSGLSVWIGDEEQAQPPKLETRSAELIPRFTLETQEMLRADAAHFSAITQKMRTMIETAQEERRREQAEEERRIETSGRAPDLAARRVEREIPELNETACALDRLASNGDLDAYILAATDSSIRNALDLRRIAEVASEGHRLNSHQIAADLHRKNDFSYLSTYVASATAAFAGLADHAGYVEVMYSDPLETWKALTGSGVQIEDHLSAVRLACVCIVMEVNQVIRSQPGFSETGRKRRSDRDMSPWSGTVEDLQSTIGCFREVLSGMVLTSLRMTGACEPSEVVFLVRS